MKDLKDEIEGVRIKIKIKIKTKKGEGEREEFHYEGQMVKGENEIILAYNEGEKTGLTNTRTRIYLREEKMEVERIGDFSTRVTYGLGKNTKTSYKTPYGEMEIESSTSYYKYKWINDKSLMLLLKYEMIIEGEGQGQVNFQMEVEKI